MQQPPANNCKWSRDQMRYAFQYGGRELIVSGRFGFIQSFQQLQCITRPDSDEVIHFHFRMPEKRTIRNFLGKLCLVAKGLCEKIRFVLGLCYLIFPVTQRRDRGDLRFLI